MATSREILKIVGLAGLALLIGQGCSQKSVNVTADSETFEQDAQYTETQPGADNPWAQGAQPFGSWQGGTDANQPGWSQKGQGQWQDNAGGAYDESQGNPQGPAQAYIDGMAQGGQAGASGDQNGSQGGLSYFGANQNGSEPWANSGPLAGQQEYGGSWNQGQGDSGPLAGLQEYGDSWNQGQGDSMANEFIQEDYDSMAEAQPLSPSQFSQGRRYGEDSYRQGTQVELQDVFFEFNSWRISQDGRQALAHDAEWLDQNQAGSITVEGHCDQRGTRDYNVVLGKKRAQAVQTYLVDLGVETHKIQVISYGKERPFCFGNNEQCYQLNRRGHLQLHH